MLYLIAHIWLWLVLAAALGFVVGWLVRWEDVSRRIDQMEDDIMLIRADRDRLEQDKKRLATVAPADAATGTQAPGNLGKPD